MSFRIHFQDVETSSFLQRKCESLSQDLQEEFPEVQRFEVTLTQDGEDRSAQVHALGKDIDLASHATSKNVHESVNDAFERLRRQLRKHHDKQIFKRRRDSRAP